MTVYFPRAEGPKSLLAGRSGDDFVEATSRSRVVIFVRVSRSEQPCRARVQQRKGLRLGEITSFREHREDRDNPRPEVERERKESFVSSSSRRYRKTVLIHRRFCKKKKYINGFFLMRFIALLSRVSRSLNACGASQPHFDRRGIARRDGVKLVNTEQHLSEKGRQQGIRKLNCLLRAGIETNSRPGTLRFLYNTTIIIIFPWR